MQNVKLTQIYDHGTHGKKSCALSWIASSSTYMDTTQVKISVSILCIVIVGKKV